MKKVVLRISQVLLMLFVACLLIATIGNFNMVHSEYAIKEISLPFSILTLCLIIYLAITTTYIQTKIDKYVSSLKEQDNFNATVSISMYIEQDTQKWVSEVYIKSNNNNVVSKFTSSTREQARNRAFENIKDLLHECTIDYTEAV